MMRRKLRHKQTQMHDFKPLWSFMIIGGIFISSTLFSDHLAVFNILTVFFFFFKQFLFYLCLVLGKLYFCFRKNESNNTILFKNPIKRKMSNLVSPIWMQRIQLSQNSVSQLADKCRRMWLPPWSNTDQQRCFAAYPKLSSDHHRSVHMYKRNATSVS